MKSHMQTHTHTQLLTWILTISISFSKMIFPKVLLELSDAPLWLWKVESSLPKRKPHRRSVIRPCLLLQASLNPSLYEGIPNEHKQLSATRLLLKSIMPLGWASPGCLFCFVNIDMHMFTELSVLGCFEASLLEQSWGRLWPQIGANSMLFLVIFFTTFLCSTIFTKVAFFMQSFFFSFWDGVFCSPGWPGTLCSWGWPWTAPPDFLPLSCTTTLGFEPDI